ncbi:hypothetical protein PQBR44_0120 (plasmid) [Pseudomonas putida UWC1]|nr:hypothetical protein PQBR44_0120 [Pseudomonas putida UWC1]
MEFDEGFNNSPIDLTAHQKYARSVIACVGELITKRVANKNRSLIHNEGITWFRARDNHMFCRRQVLKMELRFECASH